MLENIAKYRNLFVITLIILGVLLILVVLNNPKSSPSQQVESVSRLTNQTVDPVEQNVISPQGPILRKEPDKPETQEVGDKKSLVISKLPIFFDNFNIVYFVEEDLFLVKITQDPFEENRIKAVEWLKSQNLTNDDLERLKIVVDKAAFVK
ncbi:MAG: hypothetical protein A3F33_02330 [Candidatus Woykebacteria bacterium RIFCSPHIGHO2_12_FULL_43_10]|uniref:Uncharacterized protein n=2 Tax=Candidatus Woykeibacteriota TaxID=1817899 RepID=A0A1G1WTL6_9BACT|nr:MAG: hypothetical protein A3J50_00385 [Candidatus Woykebacteria bacterium RIFCSPHIGHO2_02_FULL_43_16b]OGY28813.1 MAG: hypothetical protein A3F33_02330 [Candidatus Woykebacteria bacterium RIFCSPHIGHO2_12_FULL_43_10]OGY31086.1 MAG: hypothetical protein A3A61_03975 [Candidatus Woykebacteria bacterium RIFCSPLOWO2_01_FULL_43_14]